MKSRAWYGIVIIACASLVFFLFGFVQAVRFTSGAQRDAAGPAPPVIASPAAKNPDDVNILIIGDSIAKGTGDEQFKGFGGYLPELMKNQTKKSIVVDNAGIDGLKTPDLLQLVRSGRLDSAMAAADYILISIGGNDLREIQSLKDIAKEAAYREKRDAYLAGLNEIVGEIRADNQDAVLIFIGLYDPYAGENANENAGMVSGWNYETQIIAAKDGKAVFVPTYDLFRFNLDRFIAGDRLHPNSAGYQTVSYFINKAVENTLKH
ncbi:MAG: GDSL family lipase [Firmicutes bacterium]|nr:GDSL family lipase [Bacillota bacterium]